MLSKTTSRASWSTYSSRCLSASPVHTTRDKVQNRYCPKCPRQTRYHGNHKFKKLQATPTISHLLQEIYPKLSCQVRSLWGRQTLHCWLNWSTLTTVTMATKAITFFGTKKFTITRLYNRYDYGFSMTKGISWTRRIFMAPVKVATDQLCYHSNQKSGILQTKLVMN